VSDDTIVTQRSTQPLGASGLPCRTVRRPLDIDGESRTLTDLAFHQKAAAMAIDDVFDDGEPQACTALFLTLFPFDAKKPLP
jgi:hypothetical protein